MTGGLDRADLAVDPLVAARRLLGAELVAEVPEGEVRLRIVEVEAYRGEDDPGSHCYRGRTPRNDVMWGPAGHLYVYFVYGMHFCANVVALVDGRPGAVLLRAGEVLSDPAVAHVRRPTARGRDAELARGPARLCTLLGLVREHNGIDVLDPTSPVRLQQGEPVPDEAVRSGPRVGVAAGQQRPWRLWVAGSPAVTPYKAGRARPDGPDW
ncbi:DNA-3-methyladenine glycosylase [Actinomycetospora corticicola]|uniref:Putative 3-methyladenine DNA glycosylase n=1 Tax=Actinomycetospora corticicola TaxID=663602 RepID=A0A7Y9DUG8_9PSEU|nr:DNA-3-methyladenine glycosylase [Actinomycetospora corticicola]